MSSLKMYAKFGNPEDKLFQQRNMMMWDVPRELEVGVIPKKLYCNKIMVEPLRKAFSNLIHTGFVDEIKTWDGCFNIRPIRGYEKQYAKLIKEGKEAEAMQYLSVHSWGCALDINAFENQLGTKGKLSAGVVKCFVDAGFVWGGSWRRCDPMHFQLAI